MDGYKISCNKAVISGSKGKYTKNDVQNASQRYGRNAVQNYNRYLADFDVKLDKNLKNDVFDTSAVNSLQSIREKTAEIDSNINALTDKDKMPPVKFKLKFSKAPAFIKPMYANAVIGSAFEEMNRAVTIPVIKLTEMLKTAYGAVNPNISAHALDLNKDGNIDTAEYAAYTVLCDSLDKKGKPSLMKADGVITNEGQNNAVAYLKNENKDQTMSILNKFYKALHLDTVQDKFMQKNI